MEFNILYEDSDSLVVDKPAGIVVFPEGPTKERTLIDCLLEKFPGLKNTGQPLRYGIAHRLDKDTSGILLVAKSNEALDFFQKEFQNQRVEKKYLALVQGEINTEAGVIETLIGRSKKDKRKQKVYLKGEPGSKDKREAITEYRAIDKFREYTLIEAMPKTGRKHQIRAHLAYLNHPIVGDKLYGFKNQLIPKGLTRQFLHANYLKIKLLSGQEKEFKSELPEDLGNILKNLK